MAPSRKHRGFVWPHLEIHWQEAGGTAGEEPGAGGGAGGEAPLQVVPFLKVKRKPVKDSPQRNRLVRIVL